MATTTSLNWEECKSTVHLNSLIHFEKYDLTNDDIFELKLRLS